MELKFYDLSLAGRATLSDLLEPTDNQPIGFSSCFLMASIICRHLLQQLQPTTWASGSRSSPEQLLSAEAIVKPTKGIKGGGNPVIAARDVVDKNVKTIPLNALFLPSAITLVTQLPCILPYLPTPTTGNVVVWERDAFVAALQATVQSFLASSPEHAFHAQCVIGKATNTENGCEYFVCRQTWNGSVLTLVPVISIEDILTHGIWTDPEKQLLEAVHVLIAPPQFPAESSGISPQPLTFSAGPSVYTNSFPTPDVHCS